MKTSKRKGLNKLTHRFVHWVRKQYHSLFPVHIYVDTGGKS